MNIGDKNPIAFFGGESNSASINSDGSITIISRTYNFNNEKAISVACGEYGTVALGESGQVYIYDLIESKFPQFVEVNELIGIKITQISGINKHFFAVSKDGVVFGLGQNESCELGNDMNIKYAYKFTVINSLMSYKIKSAYAGYNHSLFITSKGSVLSCGINFRGELMLKESNYSKFAIRPIDS